MSNSAASPPANVEYKLFKVPALDEDDYGDEMFTLHFTIKEVKAKPGVRPKTRPEVSFTVSLNPDLQPEEDSEPASPPSSPPKPIEYTFNGDTCEFIAVPPGGYFIKGSIAIVYFHPGQGQFFNDRCNFKFDLEFGETEGPIQQLIGLYGLINP